ncbi:hypothetical protein KAU32_11895 [bacterium]|nr:hypothetical protein [bacterium]
MKHQWKVHPLIETPLRSLFLLVVLTIIGIFVYYIFEAGFYVVLYAVFFLVSFMAYLLPTLYTADDEGLHIKRLWFKFFKEWDSFKRFSREKGGFFLSPFASPHWLEKTRGMYIMCTSKEIIEIGDFIQKNIENAEN